MSSHALSAPRAPAPPFLKLVRVRIRVRARVRVRVRVRVRARARVRVSTARLLRETLLHALLQTWPGLGLGLGVRAWGKG